MSAPSCPRMRARGRTKSPKLKSQQSDGACATAASSLSDTRYRSGFTDAVEIGVSVNVHDRTLARRQVLRSRSTWRYGAEQFTGRPRHGQSQAKVGASGGTQVGTQVQIQIESESEAEIRHCCGAQARGRSPGRRSTCQHVCGQCL